jgi:hypothetical protein
MGLTCPRCETDVPAEAFYCPYCHLPRPKAGFASSSEAKAKKSSIEKSLTKRKERNSASPSTGGSRKSGRRIPVRILSTAALVAVLSVGAYVFVVPLVLSQEAEPKASITAIEKLRRLPSNEPGVTIGEQMSQALQTSRRNGNLVSYKGWTAHPIKGTKTKVLISFSYREKGDVDQRAEWIADLTAGSFAPQSAFAGSVSGK